MERPRHKYPVMLVSLSCWTARGHSDGTLNSRKQQGVGPFRYYQIRAPPRKRCSLRNCLPEEWGFGIFRRRRLIPLPGIPGGTHTLRVEIWGMPKRPLSKSSTGTLRDLSYRLPRQASGWKKWWSGRGGGKAQFLFKDRKAGIGTCAACQPS